MRNSIFLRDDNYSLTSTSKRSVEWALEKLVKLAREEPKAPKDFLEKDPLVIGGDRSKQSSLA
jgi:hypothetical protein